VRWVRDRVLQLRRSPGYAPILHFDVYGLLGADVQVLFDMADAAEPFALRVEHPFDAGSRAGQIEGMAALRAELGGRVQLVADEWANTVDDISAFNADLAYEPTWADQGRGIPRVAVSSLTWLNYQDIHEFTQAGIKRAANVGLAAWSGPGASDSR